jgi:AcrR family transcriptional regulator
VYRFVEGRDELFADVVRAVSERERAVVEDILRHEVDSRDAVRAATATFAVRALQGRRIARVLLAGPDVPEVDRARSETRALLVDAFARRLAVRTCAVAIVGALLALLEDALLRECGAADDVAGRIAELCVALAG